MDTQRGTQNPREGQRCGESMKGVENEDAEGQREREAGRHRDTESWWRQGQRWRAVKRWDPSPGFLLVSGNWKVETG